MYDLTQRQIEILKCIVKEYIDSAEPVGSETIEKKFDLGVSPATIRNEMAAMVKTGYLGKTHSSSGRIPKNKMPVVCCGEIAQIVSLSATMSMRERYVLGMKIERNTSLR